MTPTTFGPDTYVATNNAQQQAYCDQYNHNQASIYAQGCANYNLFVDAEGLIPSWPYPKVPTQWVLTPPDDKGLRWQTTSSIPVCPAIPAHTPAINPNTVPAIPGAVLIGNQDPSNPGWFSALPGDGTPSGKQVAGTSKDGISGEFIKVDTPFGGLYQQVGGPTFR